MPSPSAEAGAAAEPAANRWFVTITVTIGAIATILATTIINVAIPNIMGTFGIGQDMAQWLSSGFLAATTTAMLMTDWFARRLGRRATYQLAMIVFVGGSLLGAVAETIELVILARLIQGAAAGIVQPLTMVAIFEAFPADERGKAMGIFGIGAIMAPSVGPYAGGLTVDAFSWHAVFLFPVPFCIVAAALATFVLKGRDPSVPRISFDWIGFALLVTFIGTLLTALSHGTRDGWSSDGILTLFAIAATSFAGFIGWELTRANPLLNLKLFAIFPYAIVTVIAFAMGASLFTSFYATPLFVQLVQGYTPTLSGLLQMPAGFAMAVGAIVFGRIGDLGYRRSLVFLGFVLVAWANYLMASGHTDTPFVIFALWIVIARVGVAAIFPNLNVSGLRALPPEMLVQGSGAINFIRQLGGAFGVNLIAVSLEHRTLFHGAALTATQSEDNTATLEFIERLRILLHQGGLTGTPEGAIDPLSLEFLSRTIFAQAEMLAFRDSFLLIAIVAACALVPALFIRGGPAAAPGRAPVPAPTPAE